MDRTTPFSFRSAILLATLAAAPLTAQTRFEARMLKTERAPTPGGAFAVFDADGDSDLDLLAGTHLHLNDGTGELTDVTATHLMVAADDVVWAQAADFDGDGDADLLVVEWHGIPTGLAGEPWTNLALHRNDGNGHFTDVSSTAGITGLQTWATVGDIDNDGDLDIVAAYGSFALHQFGAEYVYVNDGSAHFTEEAAVRVPSSTSLDKRTAVVLADLDGDGDPDIVLTHRDFGGLTATRVYANDGTGHFAAPTAIQLPPMPLCSIEHALDIDADGDLDLLVGDGPTGLLRNDGTGTFAFDPAMPAVGGYGANAPTFADMDGDQLPDLSFATQLWIQNGAGTFADESIARGLVGATGAASCAVDWDGDQDLDLTCGDGVRYLNDGSGRFGATWVPQATITEDYSATVVVADVDGNGEPDVITGMRVLMQYDGRFVDESGRRLPWGDSYWYASVAGDFDGDGDIDLAGGRSWSTWGQQQALALNDGTGVFTTVAIPSPAGSHVVLVATADLDGDLDLDLVFLVHSNYGNVFVYENDGTATFTDITATALPGPLSATSITLGDVDGDGDADLLLGRSGTNALLQNDGNGVFTDVSASSLPGVSDDTWAIALGDVDGDLDLDMFVANNPQNRLLLNDGAGVFTDVTATHVPALDAASRAALFADVDADGDQDVLVGTWGPSWSTTTQGQFVFVNDGSGHLTEATSQFLVPTAEATIALAASDFDGDGDADLVIHHDGYVDPTFMNGGIPYDPYRGTHVLSNLTTQLEAPLVARPGHPFDFTATTRGRGTTGSDAAVLGISFGNAAIPVPGVGLLAIDPTLLLYLDAFAVPRAIGEGTRSLLIPNVPGLAGIDFFAQAVVLGPGFAPRLTNRLRERVY